MLRPVSLYRFVVVHILQRIVSEVCHWFKPLRSLIADEIHNPCGRHDKAMSQFGSFHRSLSVTLPSLNDKTFRNSSIRQLIPAYHLTAFVLYIASHTPHKVTLQFFFILQFLLFHPRLTQRACFPMRLPSLISTQVDIL